MGLFDNVIAEEETATTASSSQGGFWAQDGGFLILDDAPAAINEIKAEDIPDSAISFLDLSSMNIEPAQTVQAAEQNDSFSLFLDNASSDVTLTSNEVTVNSVEVENAEDTVTMLDAEPQDNAFFNQEPEAKTEEPASMIPETSEVAWAVIADPYAILDKAIKDLMDLLKGHEAVINEKNSTIGDIDNEIAALKQRKQTLAWEVKDISAEEDKVNKMISTFQSQKV
ncbi:MAG: hypothetical protein ACD_2C00183G0001 [uncultured bacterium (gcode 4)]|uniref:Uncharacterized protein n=1 Tax=uncultured bacterium (gcode 4) TaxID=1234023 RepID=K2G4Y1_9BACT|nr:MAG: hypothetical protein ACD_2C00183G0001 [uncultured bacterium (gcode 4)]